MPNPTYYVGGTYKFILEELTKDGVAWAPTANEVGLVLVTPSGSRLTKTVTLSAGEYYYTTLTTDLSSAGNWARYWTVSSGGIVVPATDPIPFRVKAVP